MARDIVKTITTNTTTFIGTTEGQGASLSLSGATAGTFTLKKRLPDGSDINITDDLGNAIVITALPTTINVFLGAGADIAVLSAGIVGTLTVTSLPLKSNK